MKHRTQRLIGARTLALEGFTDFLQPRVGFWTVSSKTSRPVALMMTRSQFWDVQDVVQNVPVLGADSKPLGVLDIRDAMNALFEQEERQEQMLSDYITGIGYR
jgi:hypothetical protein